MTSFTGRQLGGVRVLDLTRVLAGPFCTMILADLGAEVIKIEEPRRGDQTRVLPPLADGWSPYFTAVNRSKKSVAVDLKSPEGKAVIRELAAQSDVVVENFRPGVMARLGLDPASLRKLRPDIITCSISGFGEDSPLRDSPSFDLIIQALSGVMSVNGEPSGPPVRLGIPMGDLCGGLWAALAVVAAINQRRATGEGQHIELSLLDSLMSMLGYNVGLAFNAPSQLERQPNSGHPSVVPYGCYGTKDGHITIAVYGDQFWQGFCVAVERTDWAGDDRFTTVAGRLDNRQLLESELDAILATRTSADWSQRFNKAGVPNAPVLDIAQALQQAHVTARGTFVNLGDDATPIMVAATPIRSTANVEPPAHHRPPELGEHTAEVLAEVLGMAPDAIQGMMASGAVGPAEDAL
jgi:crotonobetainyl-CoA:carnitine CoA-transferase CaiB-like acyl-CoA transferase